MIASVHQVTKRRVGRPLKTPTAKPPIVIEAPRFLLTRRAPQSAREYWNGRTWTTMPFLALKLTPIAGIQIVERRFSRSSEEIDLVLWNEKKHAEKRHKYG